ncbi:MAG: ankyrin repeat domain-containing protein [Bdellovibrionales bacterium]
MMFLQVLLTLAFAQAQFSNPLIQAVNNESESEVQKFAKDPRLVKSQDENGQDALYHAVSLNNEKILKTLLKAGAPTDRLYNTKKETLLFEASRLGSVQVVQTLLKKNPELLKKKNADDETALFEAVRANQNKLVKYYLSRGLKTTDKNKDGKTPADFVAKTNSELSKILKGLAE